MEPVPASRRSRRHAWCTDPWRDRAGAVVVEAALVLPVLAMFIFGVISWGSWMMAAHGIQQAANEAARAALVGINAAERQQLVTQAVSTSLAGAPLVDPTLLNTTITLNGNNYTVTLSYDTSRAPLFARSLVPLPASPIRRSATIQLYSI